MIIKKTSDIKHSEITDKRLYMNRRQFISSSLSLAGIGVIDHSLFAGNIQTRQQLNVAKRGEFTPSEALTPYAEATSYTNFYEFSTGKRSVKKLSEKFRTRPWTLTVGGLCEKPGEYGIDELMNMFPLEERIYRWRCVEAWSMIIPWIGFPLADFVKKCVPFSKAKFVEFKTLFDPGQMPGQRTDVLKWPYKEGLRMDEALHPLSIFAVGMYGEILPNQNGAPLRLVIPWKYGFKSIKSIVGMMFMEKMPRSSWMRAKPQEYGFYANVNPELDHPRWSQARERRIGEEGKRPTLMFNGYADQVGSLYAGMNLKKFY